MHNSDDNIPLLLFEDSVLMQQLTKRKTERVVNVASVPQRSPFRYPGGKTWLVPRLREWLGSMDTRPKDFIEPFAGGGVISLTVAFENLAERVIMVELDEDVTAVWKTILGKENEWLVNRILTFELSAETARDALSKKPKSIREHAFNTLLRNRVSHGGILAPGSGFIKNGENGKGITSRWYPETIAKRIRHISTVRSRINLVHGDGIDVMSKHKNDGDAVFFIDPPYTAAGKKAGARLYKHSTIDHEQLFCMASELAGDFLMTYDNAYGIHELADKHCFDTESIAMKNTHHAKMTELLIGRNLDWVR